MGTRNLSMVIYKKKTRVAQYGQWDGYPEGQGAIILKFLRPRINSVKKMLDFTEKLLQVKFIDEVKQKEIDAFMASIGSKDGWMTTEQSEKYHAKYPLLSRDNGAEVLKKIMETPEEELFLHDSTSFAADSLFCEYAYVIDLDKNQLEVYVGFNKKPIEKTERFYKLLKVAKKDRKGKDMYYPVRLAAVYSFDALPTVAQMKRDVKKANKENE